MAKKDEKQKKKYVVTLLSKEGSCNSPIFEKMAKKGDITSEAVKNYCGDIIKVDGYANAHIETEEKDFDLLYLSTNLGFLHTGSTVFIEGFEDYIGEVDTFRIGSVKTKNGIAYKAIPVLASTVESEDSEELPFN